MGVQTETAVTTMSVRTAVKPVPNQLLLQGENYS